MRTFRYLAELHLPDEQEPLAAGLLEVEIAALAEREGLTPLRFDGSRVPGGGVGVGYQEVLSPG